MIQYGTSWQYGTTLGLWKNIEAQASADFVGTNIVAQNPANL
jgi:hypothetical protein